jgi:sulfate adenylyltransferase subunit 1 (EFTu-like GTPase family)
VVRPDHNFRGYAGQIASGTVRPGDAIVALPSGRRSRVKSIETYDGPLAEAVAPMSVTLTLEDELDISRGDLLAPAQRVPEAAREFDATVVWMNELPLDPSQKYLLKHTTQTVTAGVKSAERLEMNAIGPIRIETSRPIYFDPYRENRATGSFILIDSSTNATVAAGMILASVARSPVAKQGPVTTVERMARYGHAEATVSLGPRMDLALRLERKLFTLVVSDQPADRELPEDIDQIVADLENSGVLSRRESLIGGDGI